jgi:hypothetical protein
MKNIATTAQPTPALRRHSIRTLTASELRVARGGFNPQPDPPGKVQGHA